MRGREHVWFCCGSAGMSQFNEAFIVRAEGADPAQRKARESELVRTTFVPVPDAAAAARVAGELLAGGLDLIELYGGLGPMDAAAVIEAADGIVPVGLVSVEEEQAVVQRAAIFMAIDADPAADRYVFEHDGGRMTLVAVPEPAAVPATAVRLVDEGAERIEICGGLGPLPAAAATEAINARVPVSAVMFGFESLPAIAAYRTRFEHALAD